jgi:hypothetical protein
MRAHWFTALAAVAAVAGVMATGVEARSAEGDPGQLVVYEGRLQNAQRRPIAGVFPLTFALYRSARGGRALWSETHFVAVDSGRYAVELGRQRPIPGSHDLDRMYLSVALSGGAEVVRDRLRPEAIKPDGGAAAAAATAPGARAAAPAAAPRTAGRRVVDYAETAGEAYEAHHAKVADKIGSITEKDLEDKLKSVKGKVTIGTSNRYTASAGGEGGTPFEIKCPKGHVVTGIRGTGGLYIDSFKLICQPLE